MKAVAIRILFGVSIALAIYVLYAHVSAWRRSSEYRATPFAFAFTSEDETRRTFAIETAPGLRVSFEGALLHVRGACARAGERVVLRAPPRRLVRSRVKMRYRFDSAAPVEVMAGVGRDDDPSREIRFGTAVVGENAEPRIVGDRLVLGAHIEGNRVLSRMTPAKLRAGADAPMTEVALGFEPDIFAVIAAMDGTVLSTTAVGWDLATLVRPTFSVTCTEPAQDVHVTIADAGWEPVWRDTTVRKLEDEFNGKVFDPLWRVFRADEDAVATNVSIGSGLAITAKAKQLTSPGPIFSLTSQRVPAESFQASVDVDVRSIHKGSLYMGVTNAVPNVVFFRMFDVGFFEREGKLVPFTNGHMAPHAQPAFVTYEKKLPTLAPTGAVVLELRYDTKTRKMRASLNGTMLMEDAVSIQPYEDIVFHLALNADGPETEMNLLTRRVSFERFP